jgi:hypothetical protein
MLSRDATVLSLSDQDLDILDQTNKLKNTATSSGQRATKNLKNAGQKAAKYL